MDHQTGKAIQGITRRLSYVGKPNYYRALEAQRFMQRQPGEHLTKHFEVEFDRGGFTYSRQNSDDLFYDKPHVAYHPHSGKLGPIDAFSRRVHLKRVGGLWLYSYKDRLSQDEIDLFYLWFEKAFKKRLKRPKSRAVMKDVGDAEMLALSEDL